MLTIVLIWSQDHSCQVSSLAEEACLVNCSKGLKIDYARAKVNCGPTNSQTSIFLVNILIFKYYSLFYQGLIMIHQGLLITHKEPKVAKLGFYKKSQLNFDQA